MAQSPVFTIFNTFDNVSILKCVFLRYPLRGLRFITTDDQWVLSIIQEGYKLEFIEKPPQSGIRKTLVSLKDTQILLEKDAIESVLNHEKPTGFYSTLFLVPKKNDKMRPVTVNCCSFWGSEKKNPNQIQISCL
jgi:hypothetical protein